jgi:hypothetical protein
LFACFDADDSYYKIFSDVAEQSLCEGSNEWYAHHYHKYDWLGCTFIDVSHVK